ncbi:hypothetical protein D3C72_2060550 [compost metagenome]
MVDREQDVVDRAIDPARAVVRFPAAGGNDQHGTLAGEAALAIAVAPAFVRVLADAVGKTIGVDALDPAFQDGRHREPPQRELQDHRVGPAQFFLLGGDVGTLAAGGERFARIQ